jgi:large subunit ribosomal protein L14e
MPAIEVGRICVKIRGREAGRKCVIVTIIDQNYVLVTGPKSLTGVRRRRVNINHVEPLDKKIDIRPEASDEEVLEAIRRAGLEDYMRQAVKPLLTL